MIADPSPSRPSAERWAAVRRYVGVSAVGNLVWETLQLPLYALWRTATPAYLVFAVVHCWIGDLLIASVTLAVGMLVAGRGWPARHFLRVAAVTITGGVLYTIFSEWLNVSIRHSWDYSRAMPRLPVLGTGLAPLLQWIIVPALALVWAGWAKRPAGVHP